MTDCHKPTFTFPGGAYHATQVRLYGRPTMRAATFSSQSVTFRIGKTEISISSTEKEDKPDLAQTKEMDAWLRKIDPLCIETWPPTLPMPPTNFPTQLPYLSPVELPNFGVMFIGTSFDLNDAVKGGRPMSPAIIYGYAYEGHCYDLPKPKIMIVPAMPQPIPDDDCGYKEKEAAGYRLWIVDKLDQCIEIGVDQGFVEQLVLEANLPGRRSPSTYRATMALSHRSGSLTS